MPGAEMRDILDTLICERGQIRHREHHIDRTFEAFRFLGRADVGRERLIDIYARLEETHPEACLRLVFPAHGPVAARAEVRPLDALPDPIRLGPVTVPRHGPWASEASRFKWTARPEWDRLKIPAGADDVLALNEDGGLRETSRFNIFAFHRHTGEWHTPPLESGCLNGVFRRHHLQLGYIGPAVEKARLTEKPIFMADLSQYDVFAGNSVRGLLRANLI